MRVSRPHLAHRLSLLLLSSAVSLVGCSSSQGPTDAGADAAIPPADAAGLDAPLPEDAPRPLSCAPDDAREVVCTAPACDGPPTFAWDGARCVPIACGACEGADCASLASSLDTCRAAHAACEAELCRATDGDWQFWAEECGHFVCGAPPPQDCEAGFPVCNCGPGRSFEPGAGCAPDDCPAVDPLPPEMLCGLTGGTWTEGICCPTTCGVFCPANCLAPACVCGALEVFDAVRGCVPATECFVRGVGETCTNERSRCEDGLICCQRCTGAGCEPDRLCLAPLCDADPDVDACGNNLRAP
jgi:hypothetical protein